MKLGLGLIAADQYFKEGDARKEREYTQAKRDSELSLLGDKTSADRSRYALSMARDNANYSLVPEQTANAQSGLKLNAMKLKSDIERQPIESKTQGINAQTGMEKAKAAADRVPYENAEAMGKSQFDAAMATAKAEDIPRLVHEYKTKGLMDDVAAQTTIEAKIADLAESGQHDSIVRLLNAKKTYHADDPKIAAMPQVASVIKAKNNQGEEFLVMKDAQGNQIGSRPMSQFNKARASLGKRETKVLKPGETIGQEDSNGKFNPSYTAPIDPAIKGAHNPAEVATAEWLVKNKDNPEAIAAYKQVHSLKGGRKEFVQSLMARGVMGNETQDQLAQKADMYGKLFDALNAGDKQRANALGATQPNQKSNTLGSGTFDSTISSLIGIP